MYAMGVASFVLIVVAVNPNSIRLIRSLGGILKSCTLFSIFPIQVEPMTPFSDLFEQDLRISQVTGANEIPFPVQATSPTASCADCGTISTRIHSRYCRTIHDLPSTLREK